MPASPESRLTIVTLLGSGVLSAALLAGYLLFNSQLAFAQFADSLLDVVTAGVLAWTVKVGAQPEDANHQFGHRRAQPVGALVTAVLTGVLAAEVVQSAISALLHEPRVEFDNFVAAAFVAKIAFKLAILLAARRLYSGRQPALRALAVDARNDILTSMAAVAGFVAAGYGMPQLDAWLALPLAALIGWSGFELAVENVRLLMGEAPPVERQQQLMRLALEVPGVRQVGELRAQYVGTEMHAHIEIMVQSTLTVREAHDIGEAVRLCIEKEGDVGRCSVHIDPAPADT